MKPNRIGAQYQFKDCGVHLDDLSDTIFALTSSTHTNVDTLPVLMGLNLSNRQIAQVQEKRDSIVGTSHSRR